MPDDNAPEIPMTPAQRHRAMHAEKTAAAASAVATAAVKTDPQPSAPVAAQTQLPMTPAQRHRAMHAAQQAEAAGAAPQAPAVKPPTPAQIHLQALGDTPVIPEHRFSPAQRHRARVLAAQAVASANPAAGVVAPDRADTGQTATEYELLRAQLGQDMTEISALRSVEAKIELKRKKLPAYDAYIDGVLETAASTDKAVQDEVFVQLMIWQFDIADWSMALAMAGHVLKFGLTLPERFSRTTPTLILEEVADAALHAGKFDGAFPVDVLQQVEALTQDYDVNDIVRAKLYKALGQQFTLQANAFDPSATDAPAGGLRGLLAAAFGYFKRAFELHDKAGVVKPIEDLTRRLTQLPAPEPAAS